MNKRAAFLVAISLTAFASLVIAWQVRHYNDLPVGYSSISLCVVRGEQLAQISDIIERDKQNASFSGSCRYLDLVLPEDAHILVPNMLGPTNFDKIGYYLLETYYLFPREIGTSLDHVSRETSDGFVGRTSDSVEEILTNGYDAVILNGGQGGFKLLRNLAVRNPANPAWFDSSFDRVIAFLLPALTALSGLWLFRFLFYPLNGRLALFERLAVGLGLGMLTVAAVTLGAKLCGWPARGWILGITAAGTILEIWRDRNRFLVVAANRHRKWLRSPGSAVLCLAGLLIFLVLFRIAGLEGLVDGDATRWMIKAKIIHQYSGGGLVRWFSDPRLAYMHLDYPTLVPSLHAATFDSIGHVDEFVTKFWPTWMLLLLFASLASQFRSTTSWQPIFWLALLGLLLLPATQMFVQWEGGTMPMIFFTVIGLVHCASGLLEKDRARLGLGLTFLFGGAMTHVEGFIILALAGGCLGIMLWKSTPLKPSPLLWRVVIFWALAALPFVCLRIQIPSLHYESGWAANAWHQPGNTLSHWPAIFSILVARTFFSADFANWIGANGQIHWIGRWDGFSSLVNSSTIALPWLCLGLAVLLGCTVPACRRLVLFSSVMFLGTAVALSGVFASLITVEGLDNAVGLTSDLCGGRYLLPVLLGWFAAIATGLFAGQPSPPGDPGPGKANGGSPGAGTTGRILPVLGVWCQLTFIALLIVISGAAVLANREPALPEVSSQNPAGYSADNSKTTPTGSDDLQTRTEGAVRLEQAGQFAEALQEYREVVRLHPDDPIALNNLAWCLATNPRPELRNGPEAIRLARRAVELTGQQQPVPLGTLAAAYAADHQFAKAVEAATRAQAVAQSTGQWNVAQKTGNC